MITTVGELREALKYSEDEEPLEFDLKDGGYLKCTHLVSSAGGRVTIVCLEPKERK
jgi:hypothetical protein